MKLFFALLCTILIACNSESGSNNSNENDVVRTDGIYATKMLENENTGDNYRFFLRFYDDGSVISVTSSGTPDEIAGWFKKGHEHVGEGNWEANGKQLQFSTSSKSGTTTYAGEAEDSRHLNLHITNDSNDNEEDVKFSFYESEGE